MGVKTKVKTRKKPARWKPGETAALHPQAIAFRNRIKSGWELDDAALSLLDQAKENLNMALRAQEEIKTNGLTFASKTGYRVGNPAAKIALTASALFAQQLALVGLNIEATGAMGRPPE
jgi:hypothetical protein